jgi:hypothetical protein
MTTISIIQKEIAARLWVSRSGECKLANGANVTHPPKIWNPSRILRAAVSTVFAVRIGTDAPSEHMRH